MPRDQSDEHIPTLLIARHLGIAPERLPLRRSPSGKFNDTYFVDDGPVPLILRDASPDAEIHRPFYLLYEVQKYIVIRRVRGNDPVRADGYRRQSLRLAEGLG